jgi:hypothetical protein
VPSKRKKKNVTITEVQSQRVKITENCTGVEGPPYAMPWWQCCSEGQRNSEKFGPYLLIIYLNDVTGTDKRQD